MTQLIVGGTQNAKETVTSLEVLEQINYFRENESLNKGLSEFTILRHDTLMNIIRDEFEEEISLQNLLESNYKNDRGRVYPMFELTLEQARQILMRESKFVRKSVIKWVTELEEALKSKQGKVPTSFREALLLAAQQQEQIEEQQKLIEQQAPKVAFTDAVVASQSSCLVGELAKLISQNGIEIGERRLFSWLREKGYLCSHGERYNIPKQKYIEAGIFELKKGIRSGNNGVMKTTITTKITGKGQIYFVNKFLKQQKH